MMTSNLVVLTVEYILQNFDGDYLNLSVLMEKLNGQ
jgi:hypothetical protein